MALGDARFSIGLIRRWLEPRITSGAKIYVDRIPATGRMIYLSRSPGIGLEMEGLIDNPRFNVQCRGAENNFEDAEAIAVDVDSVVLELGSVGWELDGVRVDYMDRTGGDPQELTVADSSSRFAFSCNYYAKVFTNIGEDYV
jgi:hypothetical protein